MSVAIMEELQGVELLHGLCGPFIWLNASMPCARRIMTHSLGNPGEAKIAALLALQVADIVGNEHVMLITPYEEQVILSFLEKMLRFELKCIYICRFPTCKSTFPRIATLQLGVYVSAKVWRGALSLPPW
jgi:hypothetical protein